MLIRFDFWVILWVGVWVVSLVACLWVFVCRYGFGFGALQVLFAVLV